MGKHAVVDHVLDQAAQLGVLADVGDKLIERHRVEDDVLAQFAQLQRLVVEDGSAGVEGEDVLAGGLGIHRDQEVDLLLPGNVAVLVGPDRVPGRQAGDVGGEQVLAGDGDPHLEDGAQQDEIGGLAAGPVDGGDLDTEVVDDAPRCRGVSRGHLQKPFARSCQLPKWYSAES